MPEKANRSEGDRWRLQPKRKCQTDDPADKGRRLLGIKTRFSHSENSVFFSESLLFINYAMAGGSSRRCHDLRCWLELL